MFEEEEEPFDKPWLLVVGGGGRPRNLIAVGFRSAVVCSMPNIVDGIQ